MLNLLKSDIFRIVKGQLGVIALLGISVLAIFIGVMSNGLPTEEALSNGYSMSTFILPIFFSNIFMISFGNEFAFRTINNSLVAGIKRATYYMGKVLLVFLLTIIYVATFAIVFTITLKVTTGTLLVKESFEIFLLQLPLYLAVSSVGILCFNLIKTAYIAVATFVTFVFVGENLLSNLISNYLPNLDFILDTFIISNLSSLVSWSQASENALMIFGSALIYALIAIAAGYSIINKREFK